jgi:hypothetical protein
VGVLGTRQKAKGKAWRTHSTLSRMIWLFLLFAFCLLPSGVNAGPAQQYTFADQWPQFRGNNQLTGISLSAIPKSLNHLLR